MEDKNHSKKTDKKPWAFQKCRSRYGLDPADVKHALVGDILPLNAQMALWVRLYKTLRQEGKKNKKWGGCIGLHGLVFHRESVRHRELWGT